MTEKTRDTIIYIIASVVCLGMMVLFAIVGRSVYLDKKSDTHLLKTDTQTTATSTEEKDKVTEIKYVVDDTPLKEFVPEIERETEFADYVSDHDNEAVVMVTLKQQKTTSSGGKKNELSTIAPSGVSQELWDIFVQSQCGGTSIPHGDIEAWKRGIGKYPPVELK